jgi:hypothetical protein
MQSCLNFVYLAFAVLAVAFMGNFIPPHSSIHYGHRLTVHMLMFLIDEILMAILRRELACMYVYL